MASSSTLRVRRSISDLQQDYDSGNRAPLETLMRAWKGIKELPADDPRAFFVLGGYHGEPFRGPGATNPAWWGGYCQHGTVLFPSWHRAYLHQLEQALQSIDGCADVTLPFWDECSDLSQNNGIPRALTDAHFELDGVIVDNPLRSFVLPVPIADEVAGDNAIYSKPAGYQTVRYPLSGLVGTAQDQATTAAHNAKFPSYDANVMTLNGNIVAWLTSPVVIPQDNGAPRTFGLIYGKFVQCLDAPSYTLFSNTTSMGAWNNAHPSQTVMALESPHNAIHLAVGGFDVPGYDASPIDGANGDMGENDTAGLDPIFYFHHCFIDYTFWTWQKRNGATETFDIDPNDPGAVYVVQAGANNQPPAGADPNAPMTMATPLNPFLKPDGSPMTTDDCVNIETQLGYTYGPGSLDQFASRPMTAALAEAAEAPTRTVHVGGLDRGKIRGSFLIAAYADGDGEKKLVNLEPVLSRWHVEGCANCQNHLEATADFQLPAETVDQGVEVRVHTRAGILGGGGGDGARAGGGLRLLSAGFVEGVPAIPNLPFTVEIR
jgi:tyrosinase